jgi:ATP synthase mitochondrial F1 complex assembly factor 2
MIPQYSHYDHHRNHHHPPQQQQRRSLAISASERPQRFYWTVDVTTTAAPADAMMKGGDRIDGDESDDGRRRRQQNRLAVRSPPVSLLHSSSSSDDHVNVNDENNNNHVTQWYTVTLDGRPVKTPAGTLLAVPSQLFAYGIAAEWDSVNRRTGIQPSNMPLMTLACTALDRSVQYDECLRFLQTDTVLYWADPHDDRSLYKRQQRAWRDLHTWMNTTFIGRTAASTAGASTNGEMAAGTTATGTAVATPTPLPPFATATAREALRGTNRRGLPHDAALTTACRDYLTHHLDVWHGTLLQSAVRETKSFVTGAALVSRAITASAAQTAARVEEEVQIDHWGLVEGQHDYDRLNGSVALHAVSFVAHCLQHDVLLPAENGKGGGTRQVKVKAH